VGPKAPTFIRPVLSLLAGLGIFVVLVVVGTIAIFVILQVRGPNVRTPTLLVLQLALNVVAAVAAGFATARMTFGRSFYTVFLLAVVLGVASLVPLLRHAAGVVEPLWYLQARPLLVLLGILAGGAVERRIANSGVPPV
jgi:hypothetical protein